MAEVYISLDIRLERIKDDLEELHDRCDGDERDGLSETWGHLEEAHIAFRESKEVYEKRDAAAREGRAK